MSQGNENSLAPLGHPAGAGTELYRGRASPNMASLRSAFCNFLYGGTASLNMILGNVQAALLATAAAWSLVTSVIGNVCNVGNACNSGIFCVFYDCTTLQYKSLYTRVQSIVFMTV